MAKIGKQDFIGKVAVKTGVTEKDTAAIVNAAFDVIKECMKKGEDVVIPGFGSWKVQKVKARKGRNIQTQEEIKIPAHKRVKFTPGSELKASVEKKKK